MPNRLTSLYFKIYYKKENYLKVKTAVFKYIDNIKLLSRSEVQSTSTSIIGLGMYIK